VKICKNRRKNRTRLVGELIAQKQDVSGVCGV